MDIEDLNKTQIILLALLVSFITSIATGIVTVSLVEQAPPGFTQTVNRVVERTVEKVVPAKTEGPIKETVKETTVVVKEEDLLTKSIEENRKYLVALYRQGIGFPDEFVGWGFGVSADGLIVTDSGLIAAEQMYKMKTADGKTWSSKIIGQDETKGVALLKATKPESETKYVFAAAPLANSDALRLGQTLIAFGGKENPGVTIGAISSLTEGERAATSTDGKLPGSKFVKGIEATIEPPGNIPGAPVISIFGEVVGMGRGTSSFFVPINAIKEVVTTLSKTSP